MTTRLIVGVLLVTSAAGCGKRDQPAAAVPKPSAAAAPVAQVPAVPAASTEVKPLLTPEPSEGTKPQRRDARPQARPWHDQNPGNTEPIPVLPLRKPSQILGDPRFIAQSGDGPMVAVSPDGRWLATGGISVFDLKTGRETCRLDGAGNASRLQFAGDSRTLLSDDVGMLYRLNAWDTATGEKLWSHHIADWSLSADGFTLVSIEDFPIPSPVVNGMTDCLYRYRWVIRIRDLRTWQETARFAVNGFRVQSVAISPDCGTLAIGGDNGVIRLWDLNSARELPPLLELSVPEARKGKIPHASTGTARIVFSPDGRSLAAANGSREYGVEERTLALWEHAADGFTCRWTATVKSDILQFSPDSRYLLNPGSIKQIWNLAAGRWAALIRDDRGLGVFHSVSFGPEPDRVYVKTSSRRPELREFPSFKLMPLVDPPASGAPPEIPFDTDGVLHSWKINQKQKDGVPLKDGTRVHSDCVTGWGLQIVNSAGDVVRQIDKGRVVGYDISPDQKMIVSCGHQSDGRGREKLMIFWDLTTGRELARMNVSPRPGYSPRFSPDGKRLAVMHEDGVVRLWDVATRKAVMALDPDPWFAQELVFSKDGRYLVCGSAESVILVVWDLSNE